MRLLIVTQAIDTEDPVLGFFHRWVEEFSRHYEHIHVICLKEGKHSLPQNVTVHSLGKEEMPSRLKYVARFFRYIWKLRSEYDSVYVHMNQEYVLLGGKFWWLWRKPVYLWRNHYVGSIFTDIAALFCKKVFCTSKFSYTAKYRKTVLMPVGIDTDLFRLQDLPRKSGSILSLGRIAPSKHVNVLVEALGLLKKEGIEPETRIYGDSLPKDNGYRESLVQRARELGLGKVEFRAGIPNNETPMVFSAHDVFVNCSGSGMYDKTIFEAAACGCIVVASSKDFQEAVGKRFGFSGEPTELADTLETLFCMTEQEKNVARAELASLSKKHSLEALGRRLAEVIT